jgi:chromosome segregation ATPase
MEIQAQREEIKKLEDEAAKWQREYYDLRDEVVQLKIELAKALQSIRDQATSAEILTVDSPPPLDTPKRD